MRGVNNIKQSFISIYHHPDVLSRGLEFCYSYYCVQPFRLDFLKLFVVSFCMVVNACLISSGKCVVHQSYRFMGIFYWSYVIMFLKWCGSKTSRRLGGWNVWIVLSTCNSFGKKVGHTMVGFCCYGYCIRWIYALPAGICSSTDSTIVSFWSSELRVFCFPSSYWAYVDPMLTYAQAEGFCKRTIFL